MGKCDEMNENQVSPSSKDFDTGKHTYTYDELRFTMNDLRREGRKESDVNGWERIGSQHVMVTEMRIERASEWDRWQQLHEKPMKSQLNNIFSALPLISFYTWLFRCVPSWFFDFSFVFVQYDWLLLWLPLLECSCMADLLINFDVDLYHLHLAANSKPNCSQLSSDTVWTKRPGRKKNLNCFTFELPKQTVTQNEEEETNINSKRLYAKKKEIIVITCIICLSSNEKIIPNLFNWMTANGWAKPSRSNILPIKQISIIYVN